MKWADRPLLNGSEIFGDLLELIQRRSLAASKRSKGVLEAMVDVILNQRTLGLADGFLHRVELLGDIHAGAPILDHGDDAAQVALGALQSLENGAVR